MKQHKVFDNKKFEIWATPDYDQNCEERKGVKCVWRCQMLNRSKTYWHKAETEYLMVETRNPHYRKQITPATPYNKDVIFYVVDLKPYKTMTDRKASQLWNSLMKDEEEFKSVVEVPLKSNWQTMFSCR